MASRQQFIPGIHLLNFADRVRANFVFEHDDIAGLAYGGVRLSRHDHRERLKIRGHVEVPAIGSVRDELTDVVWSAVGRESTQYVREVFAAKTRRLRYVLEMSIDFGPALLGFNPSIALRLGKEDRPAKINPSGSVAVLIVDRFHCALHYSDAIDRYSSTLLFSFLAGHKLYGNSRGVR